MSKVIKDKCPETTPVILLMDNVNIYRGRKRHLRLFKSLGPKMWNFTVTETQLIVTIHDLANTIQRGESTHVAVLDFSKAFDKVPHQRLLRKLYYYGIYGELLDWFESFLSERYQSVVCEGKTSSPLPVTSGVPQGTVLGPLLFLLYINDLSDNLQSTVKLFADDALLYGVITSDSDCDRLQDDLHKLEQWQNLWQMEFNPSKCKILCISNKKHPPQKRYLFCGVELDQVEEMSYLGITFTSKLKWNHHISSVASKATKVLGVMRRNLWNCPKKVRETAYKSIVRPKLEYASTTWDPYTNKDKVALERVQRKEARFCSKNYNPMSSVTDMIKDLNWESLEVQSYSRANDSPIVEALQRFDSSFGNNKSSQNPIEGMEDDSNPPTESDDKYEYKRSDCKGFPTAIVGDVGTCKINRGVKHRNSTAYSWMTEIPGDMHAKGHLCEATFKAHGMGGFHKVVNYVMKRPKLTEEAFK